MAQSLADAARTRLARAAKTKDPERIDAARRELAEAKLEQAIRAELEKAPQLSAAQRRRLALLLHPGSGVRSDGATPASR